MATTVLLRISWGISGRLNPNETYSGSSYVRTDLFGAFQPGRSTDHYSSSSAPNGVGWCAVEFDSGNVVPVSAENHPLSISFICLIRIQWGISGRIAFRAMDTDVYGSLPIFSETSGLVKKKDESEAIGAYLQATANRGAYSRFSLASSYVTPVSPENAVISANIICLLRLLWGITGAINVWKVRESIQPSGSKAFNGESDADRGVSPVNANSYSYGQISFSSSRVVPVSKENIVASYQVKCLMRILWGIYGKANNIRESNQSSPDNFSGAFSKAFATGWPNGVIGQIAGAWAGGIEFSSSRVIPVQEEMVPIGLVATCLLRIAWGIKGHWDGTGPIINAVSGPFKEVYYGRKSGRHTYNASTGFLFDISYVVPVGSEEHPLSIATSALIRVKWGINGHLVFKALQSGSSIIAKPSGAFDFFNSASSGAGLIYGDTTNDVGLDFNADRVAPTANEMLPTSFATTCLLRIAWGINGNVKKFLCDSPFIGGTGAFYQTGSADYFHAFIGDGGLKYLMHGLYLDSSGSLPVAIENVSINATVKQLIRIGWGISGSTTLSLYGEYSVGSKNEGALTTALGESKRNDGAWRDDGVKLKFDSSMVAPTSEEVSPIGAIFQTLIRIAWGIRGSELFVGYKYSKCSGALYGKLWPYYGGKSDGTHCEGQLFLDTSRAVPVSSENVVNYNSTTALMRLSWGISGQIGGVVSLPVGGPIVRVGYYQHNIPAGGGLGVGIVQIKTPIAVPTADEMLPASLSVSVLIRICWGITGKTPITGWNEVSREVSGAFEHDSYRTFNGKAQKLYLEALKIKV